MPDNLRTGVDRPDLSEPRINRSYVEPAEHYRCLVTRPDVTVATPQRVTRVGGWDITHHAVGEPPLHDDRQDAHNR